MMCGLLSSAAEGNNQGRLCIIITLNVARVMIIYNGGVGGLDISNCRANGPVFKNLLN